MDNGETVELVPLAEEICRRYEQEFPDEQARYGDAGHAWCIHDNLYLLDWGYQSTDGEVDMAAEVAWLARVLETRDFPLVRLARDLEIGAEVLLGETSSPSARAVSKVWAQSAATVRARGTFVED